jgi:toxin CcdB
VRQFDVYANPSQISADYAPYLVILQSHYFERLETVVIAPLIRDAGRPFTVLDINVSFEGERLLVAVAELGAIDARTLGRAKGSLATDEDSIRRGLERLFTGF